MTHDAKRLTDRDMMIRMVITKPSQSVHALSMRDVDEKDLIQHGLKPAAEAQEPLIEIRPCWKCKAENALVAIYCQRCGAPLNENNEVRSLRDQVSQQGLEIENFQDLVWQLAAKLPLGNNKQEVKTWL